MVVSISNNIAESMGIPYDCLCTLLDALNRVFDDGANALNSNPDATDKNKAELEFCKECTTKHLPAVVVVNGDDWAKMQPNHRELDSSVDIAVAIGGDSSLLLPVEAKLGAAFDYPGDRGGSSVTIGLLEKKVSGFQSLVGDQVNVVGKLILLVPKDGQEWFWYYARNQNLEGLSFGKLLPCCVHDFLWLLNFIASDRPDLCKSDDYRHLLLADEFMSTSPMRKVMLAPKETCRSCGQCKLVCPKHAIAMLPQVQFDGRKMPYVDELSCVGCRRCEKTCPVLCAPLRNDA